MFSIVSSKKGLLHMGQKKTIMLLLAGLILTVAVKSSTAQSKLPNPVLYLAGVEPYSAGGKDFTRYKYAVDNSQAYPDDLFAPAPTLPPCGTNTKSARTWVDFFDSRGKRLYGFCALGKAGDLNQIWFGLPRDEIPPSWVYIEMNDRQTQTKYKSNLADTVE
jgi:hypothetical protein